MIFAFAYWYVSFDPDQISSETNSRDVFVFQANANAHEGQGVEINSLSLPEVGSSHTNFGRILCMVKTKRDLAAELLAGLSKRIIVHQP